jgi:hypothetical protein
MSVTSLGVGVLGKKSGRGRHCERTFSESYAFGFPTLLSEITKGLGDCLPDTRDRRGREIGPVRILTDEVGGMLWSSRLKSRLEGSVRRDTDGRRVIAGQEATRRRRRVTVGGEARRVRENGCGTARRQASIGVHGTRAMLSRIGVSEVSLLRLSDSGELRVWFWQVSVRL